MHRDKVGKYGCLEQRVKDATGTTSFAVVPLVIRARGTWYKGNLEFDRFLDPSKDWKRRTCELILCKTIGLIDLFMDA